MEKLKLKGISRLPLAAPQLFSLFFFNSLQPAAYSVCVCVCILPILQMKEFREVDKGSVTCPES